MAVRSELGSVLRSVCETSGMVLPLISLDFVVLGTGGGRACPLRQSVAARRKRVE